MTIGGASDRRDDLPARAAKMRLMLSLLFWAVAVLLLLERLAYAGLFRGAATDAGAIATQFVFAAPGILYLSALWQLRLAVSPVAQGALFATAAVAALRRVGALLVAGALVTIFLMPTLHRLLGDPYPRLIDFDVATLILAAIGAALALVARLLERAGIVERELGEIF